MLRVPVHRIVGVCLCIGITSCVWFGTETPPEWVVSPQSVYPTQKFLIGMGEASNRDQAEKRAYAAVARIFSANVHAQSTDQETYATQEVEGISRIRRTLELDQRTHVTTTKILKNVKVLDVWHQRSSHRFFALAGLDRLQATQVIMDRLKDWDLTIETSIHQGRSDAKKIQRIHSYKQALTLLVEREALNTDLGVIRPSGESHPPPYRIPDIQREFQDFVGKDVKILVSIEGENHEEMERAILEGLKLEGFYGYSTSTMKGPMSGRDDLAITGKTKLWQIDLPDPLFKYVRWCGDIDIYENPAHRLIGVISETGREGHVTEKEARVRATSTMYQVLSQKVVQHLTHSLLDEKSSESKSRRKSQACPQ